MVQQLAHRCRRFTARRLPVPRPLAEAAPFTAADAAVVRALIHCVREEGAQAALDVLAERELEDSASTGTHRTPAPLADLTARLLPADTARVLDPACGSGTRPRDRQARMFRCRVFGADAHES
ncbi:hypothetical protein ACFUN7_25265 [Streptomyces sp. NPDC057236]|uniref:hypothetical protein n=1 Tax=Streptomyces sp. NPDC057236 TaxID=3346059 RepID=UPI00363917C2